jgi:hypothetical protein
MAILSGQKTVTAAGTAERISTGQKVNGAVMVKALPGNTGLVYVGNVDGDVDSTNGMPLSAGEALVFNRVGDLAEIWVDAAVNGEGIAWAALDL